jgi:rare lipoprotein A
MDELTAAHRTLPFGTLIRVDNRDSGRAVELRVTDRGPFAKGRILDVSRAGARALGMIGPGTARVRVTVVRPGGDLVAARGGCVVVQVAAHRDRATAESRAAELRAAGYPSMVEPAGDWYRVTVGPYDAPREAAAARDALDGFVRTCP